MPDWPLLFYVRQTFACVGPGSNGEVDMAWMMVQASPIFLTDLKRFVITQMYKCMCYMLFGSSKKTFNI